LGLIIVKIIKSQYQNKYMGRVSNINFQVHLDDKNIPEKIIWSAEEGQKETEAKAFLLSVLDKESKDTLKLDLWTKELQVNEMDKLIYNTLSSLADTYYNSTNNQVLANHIKNFAQFFGEETEVIAPKS